MNRKETIDRTDGKTSAQVNMAPSGRNGVKRRRADSERDADQAGDVIVVEPPSPSPKQTKNGTNGQRLMSSTPQKRRQPVGVLGTPTATNTSIGGTLLARNADRSAKRKSARRLIERGNVSDEDELGFEDDLARRIWDDGDDDEGDDEDDLDADGQPDEEQHQEPQAQTPSKKSRGRPKGWKKQRTPTPPRDLPAYEHFFFQNRPGGAKTSNKTLSSLALISHEDYFAKFSSYSDPHQPEQDFLHSLHRRSFDQWIFELSQGFNICVYGFGSKRELLFDFATYLSNASPNTKIVVINGYNSALTPRDILGTLTSTIPSLAKTKLPAQTTDATTVILGALAKSPPTNSPTLILLHTLDGPALRRPATQSLLARLASSPHIHLLASADTPNFPLLWDAALATQFNWLFHDTTTFQPYDVEIAGGGHSSVVDEVNALLGRSGRKLQGREGVMYVLKSLTANARNLYALLVAELLSLEEGDDEGDANGAGFEGDDEDADDANNERDEDFETALGGAADGDGMSDGKKNASGAGRRSRGTGGMRATIEYHSLYTRAMAQLITTNEVNYRGLLKEFYDHEMILSKKDALGTEMLGVPFRKEEMEVLLGELMGD